MAGKIDFEDLLPETKQKLNLTDNGSKPIKPRIFALGRVLTDLQGLTNRQALFVLRQATVLIRGYNKDKPYNRIAPQ